MAKIQKPVEGMNRLQLIEALTGQVHSDHMHATIVALSTAALRALLVYYRASPDDHYDGRRCGLSLLAEQYTRKIDY